MSLKYKLLGDRSHFYVGDTGQTIEMVECGKEGCPVELRTALTKADATAYLGTDDNAGKLLVDVPDDLLKTPGLLTVSVGCHDDENTEYTGCEFTIRIVGNYVANPNSGTGSSGDKNVQADWNQNDETADDYIKNRLGYRYEGGTERESIASIEITSEDMVTYDIDVVSWDGSEIVMVMDDEEYPLTYKDVVNGLYTYVNTDLSLTITEAVVDGTPNIIAPSSMVGKTVEFIKITIDWVYKRIPVKYLDLGGLDGSFQNLRDQYKDTLYHEINVESGGYNCIEDKYDVAEHINLRTQKTPTGGNITIPKLFALGVYTDGTLHVMDEDGNTTPVVSNVLLTSPNGTKFKLTVDNSGTLSTKEVLT